MVGRFSGWWDMELEETKREAVEVQTKQDILFQEYKLATVTKGNYTEADAKRKATPVYSGFMNYFPDAMRLVAQLSLHANEKHNPGQVLHWSKDQSSDHEDCLVRHLLEVGEFDGGNNCDHAVSVAWRAMALLQTMYEEGTLCDGS
jgi:hypothetical protein